MTAGQEIEGSKPRRGRVAGVDYGTKRIGLALSDDEQRLAAPAETLAATGSVQQDVRRILEWGRQNDVVRFVVGLPLNMDGSADPQAQQTQRFIEALSKAAATLQVVAADERLSSFQADQWLREAGVRGSRTKRDPRRDALAAAAILRAYLSSSSDEPHADE
ncbi:MAG: Holliday junction resolvase RuvX [Planctomycetes bacterium]|nr:Holliday junction resolvase RuvX [Planctomycetota bacterium]